MNKILVVEDEVNTSDLLRRYFEIVGYDVINAHTGKEAINMAQRHKPEVIILDIMLPDMDGYEVCKRLRTDSKTDRIPIVFLTVKDERGDRLEGLRLGADDYLSKPFDVEELRLRVHNIIANTGGTTLVEDRTGTTRPEVRFVLSEDKRLIVRLQVITGRSRKGLVGAVVVRRKQ